MPLAVSRIQVSILLPVEQRRENYMFTESMEYPENASTIYETAGLMAKCALKGPFNRIKSVVLLKHDLCISSNSRRPTFNITACLTSPSST